MRTCYGIKSFVEGGLGVKRLLGLCLSVLLLFSVAACGNKPTTWQKQYDLGVRYLSECNYEEAIIAFTAAIEIDSRQAAAYEQLSYAYQEVGDLERAIEVLQTGYEATGDNGLLESLKLLQRHLSQENDVFFLTEQNVYLADGTLVSQTNVTYDEGG